MIQLKLTRKQLDTTHFSRPWRKEWMPGMASGSAWEPMHRDRDTIMQLPAVYIYFPTPPRTLLYNKNDTT